MKISEEQIKQVSLTVTGIIAAFAVRKALGKGYEKIYHEKPPNAVTERDVNWSRVALWTVVSGLAATAAKIYVRRRGAKELEKRSNGSLWRIKQKLKRAD